MIYERDYENYHNSTTAMPTGCTRNCRNCTMNCTMIVVFVGGTDTTEEQLLAEGSFYDTRLPDKVQEEIIPDPIDIETIKFWRRLAQKKSRFKSVLNHKPLLKRRMLFSKSGWLATKGRLRKKGKK